ncbi:MAG: GntR family transcriptional regulator, partial [Alphaproteobacteria bacterium]
MLDTSSPQPLYQQIKQRIMVGIAGGAYPTASRLPSENALVRELGVSRMTVHRALRELTQEGVLIRVPGVGTFVEEPKQRSSFLEVRDIREEIRGRGNTHRAEVLTLEARVAPKRIAAAFGEAAGVEVFHSVILHFEDDVPLQLERRFVRPSFAPDYLAQDFTVVTSFEYLQSCGPITEVEH